MNLLKPIVAGAFAVSLGAFPAVVQAAPPSEATPGEDPARLQIARQVVDATHASSFADRMLDQMKTGLTNSLNAVNPGRGPDVAAVVNDTFVPAFRAKLPQLTDAIIHVYAENFNVEELKEILAFYQSDIGKKLVERTPKMVQEQAQISQLIIGGEMPEINAAVAGALDKHGLKKPNGM